MIQFWIGFILWPIIIVATIWLNWYRIEIRRSKPHYFGSNWSRSIFGLICLILMTIKDGFDPAYLSTWIPAIPAGIYIVSSFYLFFDPGLNFLRGKRWNYRGKSSGYLDRSKIVFYYALKLVCLAGFVYSLIILI